MENIEPLEEKIIKNFPKKIVNKGYRHEIDELRKFPMFVAEYMISQRADRRGNLYPDGLKNIIHDIQLSNPEKSSKELIKSNLLTLGEVELIDHFQVYTDLRKGKYFTQINTIDERATVNEDLLAPSSFPSLLENGLWGKAIFEYLQSGESTSVNMKGFAPYEANFTGFNKYLKAREKFSTEEWINLLILTVGLNPACFKRREKLLYLARLIPLVEIGTNSLEIGPAQTGKSFLYENISKHVRMLLGGDITPAKLIYNKSTKQNGFVFQRDVLVFDEINKQNKNISSIVSSLQQIMASNRVERGELDATTDVSLVFQGNPMKKGITIESRENALKVLPKDFQDCAFLDRIHRYIHGWDFSIFQPKFLNRHLGLTLSYFSNILHRLRKENYTFLINSNLDFFSLDSDNQKSFISNRDLQAIRSTISGYIKIIYPHARITPEEWQEIAELAVELRQNVINEMVRIDKSYKKILKVRLKIHEALVDSQKSAKTSAKQKVKPKIIPKETLAETEDYLLSFLFPEISINKQCYLTDSIPYWMLKNILSSGKMILKDNRLFLKSTELQYGIKVTDDPALIIPMNVAGTSVTYSEEEDCFNEYNRNLKALFYKINKYSDSLDRFQFFKVKISKKSSQPQFLELLKKFEDAESRLHYIKKSVFIAIRESIQKEMDEIIDANAKTPDLLQGNYHVAILPSKERINKIKEFSTKWFEFQRTYDKNTNMLVNKAVQLGIRYMAENEDEYLFNGEKFVLIAFDMNNLHYTQREMMDENKKKLSYYPPLIKKIRSYLARNGKYLALFFVSNHLKAYKKYFPESENIKWEIETLYKDHKKGEYVDVDTTLGVQVAIYIEKYKNQIKEFHLASGDKDIHKIIDIANELNIPTCLIYVSADSTSNYMRDIVQNTYFLE
ncbi:BREX system Lon protease-like protein BrxL [Candidatus Harpocratesius sp.]